MFLHSGYVIGSKSRTPNSYFALKNELQNPGYLQIKQIVNETHEGRNAPKTQSSLQFLRELAAFYAEPGYGETVSDIKFLPYDSVNELYEEYVAKMERESSSLQEQNHKIAGMETFRLAFLSVRNEMRLRTSKGAFETCSTCNAFHEILKSDSSEWTTDKIELVQKFKRLHIKLQAEERKNAEDRKSEARISFDADGNYY